MSLSEGYLYGLVTLGLFGFLTFTVLILTWLERKALARIQMRIGPMRVGFYGILQPVADALKLISKEDILPSWTDRRVYWIAPIAVFIPSFLLWVSIPISRDLVIRKLDLGLLYIVAISVLSVLGLVMAGWGSGNKYAVLGGLRAAGQLLSYEIPFIMGILAVAMLSQSLNLRQVVDDQSIVANIVKQPLGLFVFFLAGLAELGRTPFDIHHAESEVVGGPFVEYSGIRWSIFFLAEYANTLAIATLSVLLFLGGWSGPLTEHFEWLQPIWLILKVSAILFLIFWIRATLPRFRIDQLMQFAWKILLPLSFVYIMVNATVPFVETVITSNAASNQLTGIAQIILGACQILILFLVAFAISKRRKKYLTHLHQGVPA